MTKADRHDREDSDKQEGSRDDRVRTRRRQKQRLSLRRRYARPENDIYGSLAAFGVIGGHINGLPIKCERFCLVPKR